jgi:hypothetical protein
VETSAEKKGKVDKRINPEGVGVRPLLPQDRSDKVEMGP